MNWKKHRKILLADPKVKKAWENSRLEYEIAKEKMKQLKEDKDWEMINDMKSEPSIIAYMERHGK